MKRKKISPKDYKALNAKAGLVTMRYTPSGRAQLFKPKKLTNFKKDSEGGQQ